ncbi:hypothetical protein [Lysobacter arvi]|uniref:Uncharacterized protein n=1 Tax=Lysobacter arvi TaxID=3038776 RepID=A0ABU1CE44_9GAMM|nr:hypothetical protein [Lysobacter arvi]MDR0183468.1 hypothetical protein [Lysobacter arvi]
MSQRSDLRFTMLDLEGIVTVFEQDEPASATAAATPLPNLDRVSNWRAFSGARPADGEVGS